MKQTSTLISLFAIFALVWGRAEIEEQANMYPYMDEAMHTLGIDYTWRAYETTT